MADKEKRLRKILTKLGLKGKLKSVATLEEAHLVCIENRQCSRESIFIGKDVYRQKIEEGYTFPGDQVCYLMSPNPRNVQNIDQQFTSNSFGLYEIDLHR